jgi:hypothetical protein
MGLKPIKQSPIMIIFYNNLSNDYMTQPLWC